jgi:hypothetical protein
MRPLEYLLEGDYDVIKSYSGLRGIEYENYYKKCYSTLMELHSLQKAARFMEKPRIQQQINALKESLYPRFIIDVNGNFHPSTIPISTFEKNGSSHEALVDAFLDNNFSDEATMCAIIYRDILVFEKESKIVQIFHFCFSCNKLSVDNLEYALTSTNYEKLVALFLSLGHDLRWNDDGHFRINLPSYI